MRTRPGVSAVGGSGLGGLLAESMINRCHVGFAIKTDNNAARLHRNAHETFIAIERWLQRCFR
jgi:hypothetical protein